MRYQVTTQAASDALRGGGAYLAPFAFEERSVAEAARWLERPIQRTHYWVRRLTDAGLLEVTRVQPRAGRPIRFYKAVASAFYIPPELVPQARFAGEARADGEWFARAFEAYDIGMVHDQEAFIDFMPGRRGMVYSYGKRGASRSQAGLPLVWSTSTLKLTREQAAAFKAELFALRERYDALAQEAGEPGPGYRILLAVAPVPEGEEPP